MATAINLAAGPEMDREVSRWVFGTIYLGVAMSTNPADQIPEPPAYSTDIAAVWLVVEKMRELGWHHFDVEQYLPGASGDYKWIACFGGSHHRDAWGISEDDKQHQPVCREEDTAPLAICRAALAALGGR